MRLRPRIDRSVPVPVTNRRQTGISPYLHFALFPDHPKDNIPPQQHTRVHAGAWANTQTLNLRPDNAETMPQAQLAIQPPNKPHSRSHVAPDPATNHLSDRPASVPTNTGAWKINAHHVCAAAQIPMLWLDQKI